jgi:hypothetical protein
MIKIWEGVEVANKSCKHWWAESGLVRINLKDFKTETRIEADYPLLFSS